MTAITGPSPTLAPAAIVALVGPAAAYRQGRPPRGGNPRGGAALAPRRGTAARTPSLARRAEPTGAPAPGRARGGSGSRPPPRPASRPAGTVRKQPAETIYNVARCRGRSGRIAPAVGSVRGPCRDRPPGRRA